jgi:hypothetical protein
VARIRTIKPDFWTDEKIVELSPLARLLFIGLWNFSDDDGRMPYSTTRIKLQILPADAADISALLGEIRGKSLIDVYVVDAKEYLHICQFSKHQKIDKRTPSKHPNPPISAEPPRTTPSFPDGREGKGREEEGKGKEGNIRERKKTSIPMPEGMNEEIWKDFLSTRVKGITQTGLNGIAKQAALAGISLEDALQECCTRNWQSFRADWIKPQQGTKNGKHAAIAENNRRLNELIQQELAGNVAQGGLGTRIAQTPWDDLPK